MKYVLIDEQNENKVIGAFDSIDELTFAAKDEKLFSRVVIVDDGSDIMKVVTENSHTLPFHVVKVQDLTNPNVVVE